jgi:hypothetical protein
MALSASAVVTLDGTGAGTARTGPTGMREKWQAATASVKTGQAVVTNEAACRIYVGEDASSPNYVDGTLSGSTGDSTDRVSAQEITPGMYVLAVWSGGDPGAQGQLNVNGTRTL